MTADFDLPMTEEFVARVHRGVRRRRTLRALATAGGTLVVILTLFLVVRPSAPEPQRPVPAAPTISVAPTGPTIDRYAIGHLPARSLPVAEPDVGTTYAVEKDHLRNNRPAPAPDEPTAEVSMRRYETAGNRSAFWLQVLRPARATPEVPRSQITEWLRNWLTGGGSVIATFTTPAGPAELYETRGIEGAYYTAVITAPDGTLLCVAGEERLPADEVREVAAGLSPL